MMRGHITDNSDKPINVHLQELFDQWEGENDTELWNILELSLLTVLTNNCSQFV